MNIVTNSCLGGWYYRHFGLKYENPFIWTSINYSDFCKLVQNYDNIDFENISDKHLDYVLNTTSGYKVPWFTIDNQISLEWVHYRQSDDEKIRRQLPDVFWNNIMQYAEETYFRRLERMDKKNPIFIMYYEPRRYGTDMGVLKKYFSIQTKYSRFFVTSDKTAYDFIQTLPNVDMSKVFFKEGELDQNKLVALAEQMFNLKQYVEPKKRLPVTFSTCNRTKCACYCLEHLLNNCKYKDGIYLYLCCDRSPQEHIEALENICKKLNFNDYEIVQCDNNSWGYGHVLNKALDKAYEHNDVALTVEDDMLLKHEFDFTELVGMLKEQENGGIRVANCDGHIDLLNYVETPNFLTYIQDNYFYTYNQQCMLRHKNIFKEIRFPEKCGPSQCELGICKAFNEKRNNHVIKQALLPTTFKSIFEHIGYKPTPWLGYLSNYKYLMDNNSIQDEPYETWDQYIWQLWTDINSMSKNRNSAWNTRQNLGVETKFLCPDSIIQMQLEEHPFHPAYRFLSATHKADYLRCYLLHFYGGGYADIKHYTRENNWKECFEFLNNNPEVWVVGAKEIVGGSPIKGYNNPETVNYLIANGWLICKPRTEFTQKWFDILNRRLDQKFDQLKACWKDTRIYQHQHPKYPLRWAEILGQILHPLELEYKETGRISNMLVTGWNNTMRYR